MNPYDLSRLSDPALDQGLITVTGDDRKTTAVMLAHIAESQERKRYVPLSYPSMQSYCEGRLRMSEDMATKRIRAARAAREFPVIFEMVADGRLSLTAVVMLAPRLTPDNGSELLGAAVNRTNEGIEELLAERFPKPIPPARIIEPQPTLTEQNPEMASAARRIDEPEPGQNDVPIGRARVSPLSAETVSWQVPVPRSANDKLHYAQNLLGHQLPPGAVAKVLELALDALIEKLEKRKFGAGRKRRPGQQRLSANPRHIPAAVKSEVWKRDGGQCTFTSEAGHRCPARSGLEFDHIEPVARGGQSTTCNLRLRCRAHNQYEAERTFGADFMKGKRETSRHASELRATTKARSSASTQTHESDVVPWLRGLGFKIDEARAAAALCDSMPDAPLEQRVRHALSYFSKKPGGSNAMPVGT